MNDYSELLNKYSRVSDERDALRKQLEDSANLGVDMSRQITYWIKKHDALLGRYTEYRKEDNMDEKRKLAMELAVNYCQTHQDADLLKIAKEIYEFLSEE